MNSILFKEDELQRPLPLVDPRAQHILKVLGLHPGDSFDTGVIGGPKGKGRIEEIHGDAMELSFTLDDVIPRLHEVSLIIGAVRPQAARRTLREATSLGVSHLWFCETDKGNDSYLKSKLWSTGEYTRHLIEGAQQAFCTQIPEVKLFRNLALCIDELDRDTDKLALDNYEATAPLMDCPINPARPTVLAVGSERGWSGLERDYLSQNQFTLAGLGDRVLRTETACTAGLAIIMAKRNYS